MSPSHPRFTIVIVTRNRASALVTSVSRACEQAYDPAGFEVIVVDNGSTDDTGSVLNKLAGEHKGRLRIVRESRVGISYARNAGIAAAQGEWLLFLDDDAWAPTDLLRRYAELIEVHQDAVAWGGGARLRYPEKLPVCWSRHFDGMLSALDLGSVPRPLVFPSTPYGLNMLISRDGLVANGGFREAIRFGGDETDLFWRMYLRGSLVRYAPGCDVIHAVDADRFSLRWLLGASFRSGGYHASFDSLNRTNAGWKMVSQGTAKVVLGRRGCVPVATLMHLLRIAGYRLGRGEQQ